MGRKKSDKGKEKKLKHKEEQKKREEAQVFVDAANQISDHLESLAAPFHKYDRQGLNIKLQCKKVTYMTDDEKKASFDLTKKNMMEMYENSSWGWKDKDKYSEMTDEAAWYLLAVNHEEKIIAVSHFRFDLDNDDEVLYCYEIQLEEDVRGKGLGKFMMQILELIGFRTKMKKVMMTVFKENEQAIKFFSSLKYIVDETSPRYYDPMHPELYEYDILSKTLKKS